MAEDTREIGKVIQIDEGKVREHLSVVTPSRQATNVDCRARNSRGLR